MKPIRCAVIGYGMAGKYFHMPHLYTSNDYDVIYAMTKNPKAVEELNQRYPKVQIIQDLEIALKDPTIDLVVIATANDVHAAYTERALKANKHVVCEKPFVETYVKAKSLFDTAHKHHVMLRVFHNRRFDGDILTIKELFKTTDFGKIKGFSARFDRYEPYPTGNWREKTDVMAGVFYDLAPHLVHDAIEFFGLPESVSMDLYQDREGMKTDDHFEMMLYYDEFVAHLGAEVLRREPKPRFEIIGSKKTYVKYGFDQPDTNIDHNADPYQNSGLRSVLIHEDLKEESIPLLRGKHYTFYDRLAIDILRKPNLDDDMTLALSTILVMEKALQSVHDHQRIMIPKDLVSSLPY